jgi:predicted DNA-binding transcriptional regulator AlpA
MATNALNALSADHGIEPLITSAELAKILNIGHSTLESWRANGRAPRHIALGGRRLAYQPSAVREWLVEQERIKGNARSSKREQKPEHTA